MNEAEEKFKKRFDTHLGWFNNYDRQVFMNENLRSNCSLKALLLLFDEIVLLKCIKLKYSFISQSDV